MRVLNRLFGVSLESFVTLRKIYMRKDAILCHQYRQDNQHVECNIIKSYCSIMLMGMYDGTIYTPEMVAFLVSSIWIKSIPKMSPMLSDIVVGKYCYFCISVSVIICFTEKASAT